MSTCCDQEDTKQLIATRSNEFQITLAQTNGDVPITTATIECSLYDNGVLVATSDITLTHIGNGVYQGIFPLLPLKAGRSYDLRMVVTIASVVVIDERCPIPVVSACL